MFQHPFPDETTGITIPHTCRWLAVIPINAVDALADEARVYVNKFALGSDSDGI